MRKVLISGMFVATVLVMSATADGQSDRRRTAIPIPAPTATPSNEPMIISRADDFPDENAQAIPPDPNEVRATAGADRAGPAHGTHGIR